MPRRTSFASLFLVTLALLFLPMSASSQARVALVIGNSAYEIGALPNPAKDAADVEAALQKADFRVTLKIDLTLREFEATVRAFGDELKQADTALFFYAGHGIEVDGINYLVPVDNNGILREADVKYKAFEVGRVLDAMAAKDTTLNIVILDACRDNPLKSRTSASRGLAVIEAPLGTEAVFVYATAPGSVAADGSGRNSVFTSAFLRELPTPDLGIRDLFDRIGNAVKAETNGRQTPWLGTTPLSRPFAFMTTAALVAKARAERDKAASDLAELENRIAALDQSIATARNAAERRVLEVEQQKARALEAAKRLEAENARREAERVEAEASRRRAEEEEQRNLAKAERALVDSLRAQAEARRAEYERLTRTDDSLNEFLREIVVVETALTEVAARYATAATQAETAIRSFYDGRLGEVIKARAEPWESDAEFKSRVAKSRADLEGKRVAEISSRKASLASERMDAERDLGTRLKATENELAGKTNTMKGSSVSVVYGAFNRDRKTWPVTITSTALVLPYSANLRHDISGSADLGAVYMNVDAVLKAGAVAGEMDYRISHIPGSRNFQVTVLELRVLNLTNGVVMLRDTSNRALYATSAVVLQRARLLGRFAYSAPGVVRVELLAEHSDRPTAVLSGAAGQCQVEPGIYQVRASRPDDIDSPWKSTVRIEEGRIASFTIPVAGMSYSKAWRLREAEAVTAGLQIQYEGARKSRRPFDAVRLSGFIAGGAAAIASGICYYLGEAAMQDYRSAEFASEAIAARESATLYSRLFGVSVVTAGVGLVTGTVAWIRAPDTDSIGRELDASIKKLAELRAEKDAAE